MDQQQVAHALFALVRPSADDEDLDYIEGAMAGHHWESAAAICCEVAREHGLDIPEHLAA